VSKWLDKEHSQWLMILDSADYVGLFFPSNDAESSSSEISAMGKPLSNYLPPRLSTNKSLLITTRRENCGDDSTNGEQCIEVSPFDAREVRLLLQHPSKDTASGDDPHKSSKLLDILEYIPLAINQAAAFMRQN
jgi:hypothetical protein